MANRTFKIIGRNKTTKRQEKKTVYTSEADYLRYKDDIIKRWGGTYMNLEIEIYELIDEKWIKLEIDVIHHVRPLINIKA